MIRKAIVVAAFLTGAAGIASAQPPRPEELPGWSMTPSFQLLGVYEDNLLVTTASPTAGPFMRVTPSVETRYRGPLGFFDAAYAVDGERHEESLKVLDDLFARQLAVMNFESRPSDRSTLTGQARYISTRRPEEVLDPTGLVATERRTVNVTGAIAADYKTTEASNAGLRYAVSVDDFGEATESRPGARSTLHTATAALTRHRSERTAIGAEFTGKLLIGEQRTTRLVTTGVFWANSAGLRVTRSLTPHLTANLLAGVRIAQTVPAVLDASTTTEPVWQRQPEIRATLGYRHNDRQLSISYGRTQELGYGASGFIDTESFELRGSRAFGRRLQVMARPGAYRNTLAGERAVAYRVDTTMHYIVSPWFSVDGVYSYRYQDRALALSDFAVASVNRSRTRNRVAVGMTVRRPIRME